MQKGLLYLAALSLMVTGDWMPWKVWKTVSLSEKGTILLRSLALLTILGVAISL